MADIPNLAGIATADLVEKIGGGSFKASYINWARTMNLLHSHAAGWMPRLVPSTDGDVVHKAPHGAYLMVSFVHADGTETPAVPQAIMDNKNAAIPYDNITARDVTDTHVRGACKAAAFIFGLAHELWAKMPLESGYQEDEPKHSGKDDADEMWTKALDAVKTAVDLNSLQNHFKAAQGLISTEQEKLTLIAAKDTRKAQLNVIQRERELDGELQAITHENAGDR